MGFLILAACLAAEPAKLTVRWLVDDGYYLDEPPSTVTLAAPREIAITPARLETKGKVTGEFTRSAALAAKPRARPGAYDVKVANHLYYCSVRERWCKPVKLNSTVQVQVGPDGAKSLEIEIPVPPVEKP